MEAYQDKDPIQQVVYNLDHLEVKTFTSTIAMYIYMHVCIIFIPVEISQSISIGV